MIRTDDKAKCCGCKTCSIVCPKSCISFTEDSLGAFYPIIDSDQCINCGRCESVCPMQRSFSGSVGLSAFAAFSDDKGVRFRGSSGGMFETFATWVIENGGAIFASKFDSDLQLKGFEATTIAEVRELTKSKYLQSDLAYLFPTIQSRTLEGRYTLFCGTPCQVSALRSFLGKDAQKDNLFLVDFFCHGVPTQAMFDRCIKFVEKKKTIHVKSYEFRSKRKNGSTPHYYTIVFEQYGDKKEKTALYCKDPFYLGFQKYITLRDSCYHCPFGHGNHQSDITIGDFHDVDRYISGVNRFDGVSTVLINTSKGTQLWQRVKDGLTIFDIDIQTLIDDKVIYTGGTREPAHRNDFLRDLEAFPFDIVVEKWLNTKAEWKKEIYYLLPSPIRNAIKGVLGMR